MSQETKPEVWLWERFDDQGKRIEYKVWFEKPNLDIELWNATLTPLHRGEPIRPKAIVNHSERFVYGL